MTTDPTPPTPETLLAEALEAAWEAQPFVPVLPTHQHIRTRSRPDASDILAHAPLRDVITRGLSLTAAVTKAANNLSVIALTLTDHPEYPRKDADIDAARALARFTASDLLAALGAAPEATE